MDLSIKCRINDLYSIKNLINIAHSHIHQLNIQQQQDHKQLQMFDAPPLLWVTSATDYYAGDKPRLCHQARQYKSGVNDSPGEIHSVCIVG